MIMTIAYSKIILNILIEFGMNEERKIKPELNSSPSTDKDPVIIARLTFETILSRKRALKNQLPSLSNVCRGTSIRLSY